MFENLKKNKSNSVGEKKFQLEEKEGEFFLFCNAWQFSELGKINEKYRKTSEDPEEIRNQKDIDFRLAFDDIFGPGAFDLMPSKFHVSICSPAKEQNEKVLSEFNNPEGK